jgi:glycosyltransferase involved in cell wall biosynthesis
MGHEPPGTDQDAVTVVVPTRNRARILRQTIESILRQRDVSLTLIVVNDASTDDTEGVLADYPNIVVIHNSTPVEQRKARNDGASLAQTPWIAFCDDDDLWAPTKLRRQLDAMASQGADWCTVSTICVDEKLAPVGGHRLRDPNDIARLITRQNVVPAGTSGVLMRKQLFDRVGGFREGARYVEDWDLWIRMSQVGTACCIDELLVALRKWARSYSHDDLDGQHQAFLDVVSRYRNETESSNARPRHAGSFELQQRLDTEPRSSLIKEFPRIFRESPESWQWLIAVLLLPDEAIRRLRVQKVGRADVRRAEEWLRPYRMMQAGPAT